MSYLTRNIEDLWFGSWKCLLLGEWLNSNYFDSVLKNLVNDLKSKCNLEVNEGLLKIILGGSKKDFFFDKGGCCEEARSGIFGNATHKLISSEVAFELLNDAFYVLEVDDPRNREPVILVLDSEVQVIQLFLTFLLCCFEIVCLKCNFNLLQIHHLVMWYNNRLIECLYFLKFISTLYVKMGNEFFLFHISLINICDHIMMFEIAVFLTYTIKLYLYILLF